MIDSRYAADMRFLREGDDRETLFLRETLEENVYPVSRLDKISPNEWTCGPDVVVKKDFYTDRTVGGKGRSRAGLSNRSARYIIIVSGPSMTGLRENNPLQAARDPGIAPENINPQGPRMWSDHGDYMVYASGIYAMDDVKRILRYRGFLKRI